MIEDGFISIPTYHQTVENLDADDLSDFDQVLGDFDVLLAGGGGSTRMVGSDDDGHGAVDHRRCEHLRRIHQTPVDRSDRGVLLVNYLVGTVERETAEVFDRLILQISESVNRGL